MAPPTHILAVHATPIEGGRVASTWPNTLELGVGKSSAAAKLAVELAATQPEAVLIFGVCGAHRVEGTPDRLKVGDLCLTDSDLLADEGAMTEDGFSSLADLGIGEVGPFKADPELTRAAAEILGGIPTVSAATVSTCSATNELAQTSYQRTKSFIESMEGAAAALVCRRYDIPFLQLRCVSNFTGDRQSAQWNLDLAADRVQTAALQLLRELDP